MRVISYNCQSFRNNVPLVKSLLNRCEILLIQETHLPESGSGVLDDLDDQIVNAFAPAIRKDDVFVGRSSGGLAIFLNKIQNIVSKPIKFNDRIMGLKLRIDGYICLILNAYSICDYTTIDSLIEYNSIMVQFKFD